VTNPALARLAVSWELSLQAEGYAANTLAAYRQAMASFTAHLIQDGDPGPEEITRDHLRRWLVEVRETRSASTARGWFSGVRHFWRWAVKEEEVDRDPTEGIRTPAASDPRTPVISPADLRKLLDGCKGRDFVSRRDLAIIYVFIDGGLRLAELAGLQTADVDLRERILYVKGKGTRRSGPRHRAVPLGIKAAQALDRYMRGRERHPFASSPALWLGDRNRAALSYSGIKRMVERRGSAAGLADLHPHKFRHTWASAFREAEGSEGDLMVLGGWRSRQMLDRYGKSAAEGRARDSYRRLSLGDRL
jgi:site-specific recombinase XerD